MADTKGQVDWREIYLSLVGKSEHQIVDGLRTTFEPIVKAIQAHPQFLNSCPCNPCRNLRAALDRLPKVGG